MKFSFSSLKVLLCKINDAYATDSKLFYPTIFLVMAAYQVTLTVYSQVFDILIYNILPLSYILPL